MKGLRTFIGVFPPPDLIATLSRIQSSLKVDSSPVRWENSEKLHVTLKFLGDLSPEEGQKLREAMLAGGFTFPRFTVLINRLGCFPLVGAPRTIWIGSTAGENSELAKCSMHLETLCASIGLKKEKRDFHPHITLGRVKGKLSALLIKSIENTNFEPIEFLCTELLVMKSDLSPTGSAYSQLYSIPLSL